MQQTKKLSRKVISYVLALVMVFSTMTGIVPGMSLTAQAATETYTKLMNDHTVVKFNGYNWYIIEDNSESETSGTVTLLAAGTDFGTMAFKSDYSSNSYNSSDVKGYLDKIVEGTAGEGKPDFKDVASAIEPVTLTTYKYSKDSPNTEVSETTENAKLYLLSISEAANTEFIKTLKFEGAQLYKGWWLRSPGNRSENAAIVHGEYSRVVAAGARGDRALGVRPALKLDLSKVTFDSNNNTFSVGSPKTNQTVNPPTAASGLTYTGDEQALLSDGASVSDGNGNKEATIQYSLTPTDDNSWVDNYTAVKAKNVGEYKVYYRVAGNDTYADFVSSDEQAVTVKIEKANPETPTGITGKYGQKLSTVSLPGGWSWADGDTIMNAGVGDYTYKANYNPTDATNYNGLSNVDLTVKVGKGDGTISFGQTVVESTIGAEPPSVYFESTGDGVVTFTSENENVATVNDNGYLTIKGVGETTITASVVDSATYQYATKSVSYKLIVKKRSASIKTVPTASEITYGQTLADSTLSGGEVFGNIEGTFSWADSGVAPAVSDSETTEYAVKFTPKNSDIYAESTCKVKVKVKKAAAPATKESLSPEQKPAAKNADDLVYTGEPIELVTAPANPLEGYKVQYSKDNGTTWTDTIPTETDVDTYTVKVKYVSDNYENIDLDDITVTITSADKKALNDAIAAAKEYYDTIKDNADYKEAADKLDKAIKAAEEVAAKNKVTKAEVSTATEAITKAKAAAEAEVKDIDDTKAAQAVIDKINELKPVENIKPEDRTKIEAAREAYKKLSDDQKTKLTELDSTAVSTLEAAEKALDTAEKAAFDDEKEAEKKAADNLAADGDSDASKKLIEDAKKAIDELAYDETKSLDENKAALAAIVSKLKSDLTDNREAEQKEADDTAAAKKVTDAVNALPAGDKVATTDKAAIEAARKAYDALTADQKAKVSAETLKKLEEAEKALAAAEKEEADTAAAEKVAETISALPASDKVATTDKAAIEAARKAYDALTADQKAKVSAETLKKLEEAEKALAAAEKKAADDAKKSEGKNEWIDGQWYGADGNTEYKAKGSWKQNDKGWWYEDTDGWYPVQCWQKIDGLWYYFGVSGYMAASEWIDGWWCDADGACRYEYQASWKQDSTGWWYGDASGWYAVSSWQKIDNIWYYFGADGYLVTNQYVGEYWVNANGEWAE